MPPYHAALPAPNHIRACRHAGTDVLIGPHGADLVNALGLHAGASVLEVLPVHKGGCPCGVFQVSKT